jgi:hypothetical protein
MYRVLRAAHEYDDGLGGRWETIVIKLLLLFECKSLFKALCARNLTLIVRCPYDTRTPQVPYTNDDDFS